MKSIKEKELLVNFARSMGQEADADLIEEVEVYNIIKNDVHKSIKENIFKDLSEAFKKSDIKKEVKEIPKIDYPTPPSLDDLMGILNETIIQEEINELVQEKTEIKRTPETIATPHQPDSGKIAEGNETKGETAGDSGQQPSPQTLADVTAKFISESPKTSYQQPDPLVVSDNMDAIRGKLKFLEQWIAKVSMAGPGGGADSGGAGGARGLAVCRRRRHRGQPPPLVSPAAALDSPYALLRCGNVAKNKLNNATPKATACMALNGSSNTRVPISTAEMGSITLNTPAWVAGTVLSPVIQSHTVHTLAAKA